MQATGGHLDVQRETTTLLIGAVIWSYLGIIFEILTETVAWERWEGTIEYTFMAPLSRAVHLGGMGLFAVIYGVAPHGARCSRSSRCSSACTSHGATSLTALVLLAVASVSFVGLGMVTAVLPLISPEKGAQLGFIAQGLLLVVSGVYYPVSVLPQWMQWISTISPATYALRGIRAAILDGAGLSIAARQPLASAPARRSLDPARVGRLRSRRALRQAPRQAEALGLARFEPRHGCGSKNDRLKVPFSTRTAAQLTFVQPRAILN